MSVTDEKTLANPFDARLAERATQMARETLQIEADAILALKDRV
ncbi:MAG: KpsF/GutQ family sugar-phosphate isomerase, partial [Oxalobacteraceae bacterium]